MSKPVELQPLYEIVEQAIASIGVDPKPCRRGGAGQWNMRKGSARIWLDLWFIEEEGRAYFQVMSPVVPVPKQRQEAFYKELLTVTDRLFGVAFTLYDGWAWIKSIREVEDLSVSEAKAMLIRVGNYADHYDNVLIDKYNITIPTREATDDDRGAARKAPRLPELKQEDTLQE